MISVLLTCVFIALYFLYAKNYRFWKLCNVPYETPFFLFGSFYKLSTGKQNFSETISHIYNKFSSPYVGIYIFHQPVLLIRSPKLLKKILVKDFNTFPNRNLARNEEADPLSFHSLFTTRDAIWREMRSKITPVFTPHKLKLMFPLMQECLDDLHEFLCKHSDNEVDVKTVMKKYVVDIIASTAFGIKSSCLREEGQEFFQASTKLLESNSIVRTLSIFCFFYLHKFVHLFKLSISDKGFTVHLYGVFKKILHEREEKKIVRNDLIDQLISLRKLETITDNYKLDTETKMASQALTFLAGGNDTTAITLANTLYELALNKEIQDRLRDEVTTTFRKSGVFSYDNLQKMKYLDMVFNETLRKYPVILFMTREANSNYTFEETGFTLDKGISVMVPVIALHYDPKYYPDPKKYDPERFNDENKRNLTPYTYLPFGEGPRNCIGERFALLVSKAALAMVVKDFVIEATKGTPVPLILDPISLLWQNKGPLYLKLSKI